VSRGRRPIVPSRKKPPSSRSDPLAEYQRKREPDLARAMTAVIQGGTCPDRGRFYRLRSAGYILGSSPADARARCGLYRQLALQV